MSRWPSGAGLDQLLVEAFNTYREGLRRQPDPPLPFRRRTFDALKFLGTIGWLPVDQRLRLHKLHLVHARGLFATRDGRLNEAVWHFARAREHLELLRGGERLGWLLGASTYEAGAAYLDFRQGDAATARERLDRAMDSDLELERAGLPVMVMHRVQQGHNLARMEVRLGRREASLRLAGALLAYMERRVVTLPYHREWGRRSLQAVPRSLIRAMIHQVIAETAAFIVTGDAPAAEWCRLIDASWLCPQPESAVSPQVQFALRAQRARIAGDAEGYLRTLRELFRLSIRNSHVLWYAILIELVDFCREVDTRLSRQVGDVIGRDSSKWVSLPPYLRDRLSSAVEQHTAA
jgi:hypothetical protein